MSVHYHKDDRGILVRCYHTCRATVASTSFWIGVTLSFPIEHFLWTKVWPFSLLSVWMGL